MKYRYAVPLYLVIFILQTTWLNHIKLMGIAPNLVLCCLITLTFYMKGYSGAVLGVLAGLMQDVCFGTVIGPSGLSYFVVFLLIRQFRYRFYQDSFISVICISILGTLPAVLIEWAARFTFGGEYHILYVLLHYLPLTLAYNFVIMLLFYLVLGRRMIRRHPEDSYR